MSVVLVPEAYRGPTRGLAEVAVQATSVREALQEVEDQHPGLRELVVASDGSVHRFVTLFKNGEQLGHDALDVELKESDRLEILAAIAGG
jgi:molybdopterin converting factor small subunit